MKGANEVHLNDLAPGVRVDPIDRGHGTRDARVVNQHVQAAQRRRGGDHALDVAAPGDIADACGRTGAFPGQGVQALGVDVADEHPGTVGHKARAISRPMPAAPAVTRTR